MKNIVWMTLLKWMKGFEGHRKKQEVGTEFMPVKELDRQVKANIAVSTTPVKEHKGLKHKPKTKAGYIKMNTVSSLSGYWISAFNAIAGCVGINSILF